jgi:hypothetical protein
LFAYSLQVNPSLSEAQSQQLYGLFNTYVDAGLAWVRQHGKEYISSVNNNLTTTLCAILQVSHMCRKRCWATHCTLPLWCDKTCSGVCSGAPKLQV